jgi:hypothetical protein
VCAFIQGGLIVRYNVGWPIAERVLALTHFEPQVTMEDFAAIVADTQAAMGQIRGPFHMLIDNRRISDTTVASLATMLQAFPLLNHPSLRWIVMILPPLIQHEAARMPVQQHGEIRLKYVGSLDTALRHLATVDATVRAESLDHAFFAPPLPTNI